MIKPGYVFARLATMVLARPVLQPLNRALFQVAARGLGYCAPWDPERSGEAWFLRRYVAEIGGMILDVGANRGDWSRVALAATTCSVTAFEPLPACVPSLGALALAQHRAEAIDPTKRRFRYVSAAVGESRGLDATVDLRFGEVDSEWSSTRPVGELPAYAAEAAVNVLTVPSLSIDEWMAEEGPRYTPLAMLKVDVEGGEVEVLRGAQETLTGRLRPRFVQLELNDHQLLRGVGLRDLAALLPGYVPFMLLPRGLRRLDLDHPRDNLCQYANVVFVRGDVAADM